MQPRFLHHMVGTLANLRSAAVQLPAAAPQPAEELEGQGILEADEEVPMTGPYPDMLRSGLRDRAGKEQALS